MWFVLHFLGFVSILTGAQGFGMLNQKSWTYEIKSIESTSSDTDLLVLELQKERIARGVYAVSGIFFLKFDIVENDGNTVTVKTYRSSMGDGVYNELPFQIATIHWHEYMNTFYKDALMESMHDCSDLPYFKDKFEPPLEKKKYTLTKCQISQEGFPNYMQDGTYKFEVYGNGTVNWNLEVIVDIQATI